MSYLKIRRWSWRCVSKIQFIGWFHTIKQITCQRSIPYVILRHSMGCKTPSRIQSSPPGWDTHLIGYGISPSINLHFPMCYWEGEVLTHTVDGSEIRRTTWDAGKTLQIMVDSTGAGFLPSTVSFHINKTMLKKPCNSPQPDLASRTSKSCPIASSYWAEKSMKPWNIRWRSFLLWSLERNGSFQK